MITSQRRPQADGSATGTHANIYQLTLVGLVLPVRIHLVFNLLAVLCMGLMGHARFGVAYFLGCMVIDTVNQRLIRRWLVRSPGVPPLQGLRKLAALCVIRMTAYLAPVAYLAMTGRAGELIYFAIQLCSLVILAQAAGALSRLVFWAFAAPVVVAVGVVTAWLLPLAPAIACLVAGAAMLFLLVLISTNTHRAIITWHGAFNAKVDMVSDLQAARDQAVAEREAADLAREEARYANRAKSNFLATMSHEIRTPMNGVLGMAQVLKRDEIDPTQSERLDVLIESGEYLLSILNDILDVSKIDAGRMEIVAAPENLRHFFQGMITFWRPRAVERGLSLALHVDPNLSDHVLVDGLRMRQIMFNLLGNALKFTEAGSVAVSVNALRKVDGVQMARISVRDTGLGIARDQLPLLFERFSQADTSGIRKLGGTGLGLAIAKQLTELMGGKISVESELGHGSTFHLELPLPVAKAQAAAAAPVAALLEPAPEVPEGLQILAVDDNAVNLLVLDQLLAAMGHTVTKAASGREALELAAAQAFDLVLMDIQMPGMNGIEALEALRAAEGPNRDVAVVALTADVTSGGRDRYLEVGFTEHASKPIQVQTLTDAMARALAAAPPVALRPAEAPAGRGRGR